MVTQVKRTELDRQCERVSDISAADSRAGPAVLALRCRCGHVCGCLTGVSASLALRFVCYCRDCQAFARFLNNPGVLNDAGGTDIVHVPAAHVKLTRGADALRCVRLSRKVLRWYAGCCRTAVANTATSARFPVVGLIHSFLDYGLEPRGLDALLGAPLCRIYDHSATGPLPPNAPPPPSTRLFARRVLLLFSCWLGRRGKPNPFFDDRTRIARGAAMETLQR